MPFADLSGEGARRFGGRWNSSGRPLVYAARDAALAVLEVRVHLDLAPELIPDDYVLMSINVSGLAQKSILELPSAPAAVGDVWLRELSTPLLEVPSFIVPESRNCLLNPTHPEAAAARIVGIRPFGFDYRLWLPLRRDTLRKPLGEPGEEAG